MVWRLVPVAIAMLLACAGLDMLVQVQLYRHEQKMSHSEVKREQKESYGAPEIRQARNRLRNEATRGTEHAGSARANMCFYSEEGAVGVRFHPEDSPLPRVVAIARDPEAALALREEIAARGHPGEYNPALTGACLRVPLGAPVPEVVFQALVEAIARLFAI